MKCICEKKDREMDKKQKEKDERYEVESVICISVRRWYTVPRHF